MTDSSHGNGSTHGNGLNAGYDDSADHELARSVFAGLSPRQAYGDNADADSDAGGADATSRHRIAKSLYATVPIILVGSMAMSLNLTTALEPAQAKRPAKPKAENSERTVATAATASATSNASTTAGAPRPASAVVPSAQHRQTAAPTRIPSAYRVVVGDTVADIAARFGLSTPSVLALNGLSWSSPIFPGQVLTLGSPAARPSVDPEVETTTTATGSYTIVAGDTISAIAERFGVSTIAVLMANGLGWSSIIYPGQQIIVPGAVMPDGTPSPAVQELPDVIRDQSTVSPSEQRFAENPSQTVPGAPPASEANPASPEVVAPPPAPEPAPPASPAPQNGTYTIVAGDTISAIASRFGVSTQALLDANGLTWSSVIYGGQTLIIPGVTTPPSAPTNVPTVSGLTDEMATHARTIIDVGRELDVPDYGIVIALATAMQESSLRNLDWGDSDSVGLFQQRPSSGWGTVEQLTTPSHAARLFYGGPSNPNRGYTRGLLDISGWQSMSLTQAAQAVQISGHPDAYAKWEESARSWFAALG